MMHDAMEVSPSDPLTAATSDVVLVEFTIRVFTRHLATDIDSNDSDDEVGVYLLGSVEQIGAWDVDRAVPLDCIARNANETEWRVQVAFSMALATATSSLPLEYKYVLKHRASDSLVSWEALPGDRTLTVSHHRNVALKQPARQSSTFVAHAMPQPGPRVPALGVNGDCNGYQEWRCVRTRRERNAWFEVDLGRVYDQLTSVELWKARTYHEQQPPALTVIVSTEPLDKASTAGVTTYQIALDAAQRVESVALPNIAGRYVRLQPLNTATLHALAFAQLEVFAADANGVNDASPPVVLGAVDQHQDDGFYGVESHIDGDARECIDSEWLAPTSARSDVRFWVGSFQDASPAVQWLVPLADQHDAVSIELECDRLVLDTTGDGATTTSTLWKKVPVDSRSSELLDKSSRALVAQIETLKHAPVDWTSFLNTSVDCTSLTKATATTWLETLAWLQNVPREQLEQLYARVETQTIAKGTTIVAYGERRRTICWLARGTLELQGPPTSLGALTIATLAPCTVWNDRSVFGYWPPRAAAFYAATTVTCAFLDAAALVDVLGAATVASLRTRMLRHRASACVGDSKKEPVVHFTDATRAQVFRTKVPTAVLPPVAAGTSPLAHRFAFAVYAYERGAATRGARLGTAHVVPTQLIAHGEGTLTLPIIGLQSDVLGQLTLSYVVIHPFVHARNTLATLWRSYWRPRAPLNAGHRGMGRSFYQVDGYRRALTRENTLASFVLAGRSGADVVEFDVQLTRDRVPVLYHDFMLRVELEDKHAWSLGTRAEPHDIGIHDLSLRELERVHTTPTSRVKHESRLQHRIRKHWQQLVGRSSARAARSARSASSATTSVHTKELINDANEADDSHLVTFFPQLQALLTHVPANITLNVEIKYPDDLFRTSLRASPPFAMNAYVDAILACVFAHASANRRLFFSCFDPTLCVLLRAKQARYPVLLLTYGSIASPKAFDVRLTLQFALHFAALERLSGIVSNSDALVTTPALIDHVKATHSTSIAPSAACGDRAMVLLTWGDQNTNYVSVQHQKQRGLDGVISDNIGDLVREDRAKNVVAMIE